MLKRHLPSVGDAAGTLAGSARGRAVGESSFAHPGAGRAASAISGCARARVCARGEGRAPSAHTDGPLGARAQRGTGPLPGPRPGFAPALGLALLARARPLAAVSRAAPQHPGERRICAHTRIF